MPHFIRHLLLIFIVAMPWCSSPTVAKESDWIGASGTWHVDGNWSNGVPDAPGDVASFVTAKRADKEVSMLRPVVISQLQFETPDNTSIVGRGAITLAGNLDQPPLIRVAPDAGSLSIRVPVESAVPVDLDIATGRSVEFVGPSNFAIQIRNGGTAKIYLPHEAGKIDLSGVSGTGNVMLSEEHGQSRSVISGPIDLDGNFVGDRIHLELTQPANISGTLSQENYSTTKLNGTDNSIGEILVKQGGNIEINGNTTVNRLTFLDGELIGTATLTVAEPIDIQRGKIDFSQGRLVADTINKTTNDRATLRGMGPGFSGQINAYEGEIHLGSTDAIGDGTLVVHSNEATIYQDGESANSGTILLNNARVGPRGHGVMQTSFGGDLHLGDEGSVFATYGGMELSGKIMGGGLELRDTIHASQTHLSLRTPEAIYTGPTRMVGTGRRGATLNLFNDATLMTTSSIELRSGGQLYLSSLDNVQRDMVGDHIPITMAGGYIYFNSTGERFGDVAVTEGHNAIRPDHSSRRIRMNSLSIDELSALEFYRGGQYFVDSWENQDFVGANVTIVSDAGPRFASYSTVAGLRPFTQATMQTGPIADWQPDDHVSTQRATLRSDTTITSLTFPNDGNDIRFSVGSSTLNLLSGGFNGAPHLEVRGSRGRITAGGQAESANLYFNLGGNASGMRIEPSLSDNPGPDGEYDATPNGPKDLDNGKVGVVFNGEDAFIVLDGENTHSGPTVVNGAIVRFEAPTAISPRSDIIINGGGLEGPSITAPSVHLKSGHIRGQINTPLFVLESGFSGEVIGNGRVLKTTDRIAQFGAPSFNGTLDVEDGTLLLSADLGSPTMTILETARLTGDAEIGGNITLAGGEISPSYGGRQLTLRADSSMTVTKAARVGTYWQGDRFIMRGQTSLAANALLELFGDGEIELRGIKLSDNASLLINSTGPTQIGPDFDVAKNTRIEVGAGSAVSIRPSGTLRAIGPDSSIDFVNVGNSESLSLRSVHVPDGASLKVLVDGQTSPLRIAGPGNQLLGSGTIESSVFIGDGTSLSPGDSEIGTLTIQGDLTLEARANWLIDFNDAVGGPGMGWDQVDVSGLTQLPEDGAFNFVVRGDDGAGGDILNFDSSQSARWQILAGSIANAAAAENAIVITRGFGEFDLPTDASFSLAADESGLFLEYLPTSEIAGDLDGNGILDVADIQALDARIAANVYDEDFDLNADGRLDSVDRNVWVTELAETFFGDSNLDGEFNSGDFVEVFAAGRYDNGVADWSTGDWNGDGRFDSSDFILAFQDGGYEQGRRVAAMVPEARFGTMGVIAIFFGALSLRRTR